jgi:hypothetical protein
MTKPDGKKPLTEAERELRNIYAGMALPAVIAARPDLAQECIHHDFFADQAFKLADAMIIRSRK